MTRPADAVASPPIEFPNSLCLLSFPLFRPILDGLGLRSVCPAVLQSVHACSKGDGDLAQDDPDARPPSHPQASRVQGRLPCSRSASPCAHSKRFRLKDNQNITKLRAVQRLSVSAIGLGSVNMDPRRRLGREDEPWRKFREMEATRPFSKPNFPSGEGAERMHFNHSDS